VEAVGSLWLVGVGLVPFYIIVCVHYDWTKVFVAWFDGQFIVFFLRIVAFVAEV